MWGGCQQPEYTQCEPYSGSGNIFVLTVVMFILLVIVLGSVFY